MSEKCSKEVTTYSGGGWPFHHQCSRKAVVFVEGKGYCKQHSPDATAKREAEKERQCKLTHLKNDARWKTNELGHTTLKLHKQGVTLPDELRTACDAIIALEEERKKLEGEG